MNSSFNYYGERTYIDEYSAAALNLIAGHRATQGNCNAPANVGVFMQDLPDSNTIILKSSTNLPLNNAYVSIYQGAPSSSGWYDKYFDNLADLDYTTNDFGEFKTGRCPFSNSGTITHNYLGSNGVMLLRIEYQGQIDYVFFESWRCNLQYWQGNAQMGIHEIMTDIYIEDTTINNIEIENDRVILYPNPTDNSFLIHTDLNNYKINIYNLNGQCILNKQNCLKSERIDISTIPAGIYFININSDGFNETKKLIIK
jgi:hypothetical protein